MPSAQWDARRMHAFLIDGRNWEAVTAFYADLACGNTSLSKLGLRDAEELVISSAAFRPKEADETFSTVCRDATFRGTDSGSLEGSTPYTDASECHAPLVDAFEATTGSKRNIRGKKRSRQTYKLAISYFGPAFCGWMAQPGLDTVESVLSQALTPLLRPSSLPEARTARQKKASELIVAPETCTCNAQDVAVELKATERSCAAAEACAVLPRLSSGSDLQGEASSMQGSNKRQSTCGQVSISVAGRTDKGVSATCQVASFYSWHPVDFNVLAQNVVSLSPSPRALRLLAAEPMPRTFHATFSAQWRRYVYLLPLRTGSNIPKSGDAQHEVVPTASAIQLLGGSHDGDEVEAETLDQDQYLDAHVECVDAMLRKLVGKPLDFNAFARDTPKGKSTVCTLLLARAKLVEVPPGRPCVSPGACLHVVQGHAVDSEHQAAHINACRSEEVAGNRDGEVCCGGGQAALCVELIGDRFLRRMVRVLVGTAVRESARLQHPMASHSSRGRYEQHADISPFDRKNALLELCNNAVDRTATASFPAPAEGLCFAGVGYDGHPGFV